MPDDFTATPMWQAVINELVQRIERFHDVQSNVDDAYGEFCNVLKREMEKYLSYSCDSAGGRKRFRKAKPFRSEELTVLWKDMNSKEMQWLSCKSHDKRQLEILFRDAQKIFDKRLTQTERRYRKESIINIDTDDRNKFWNHFRKLGPRNNDSVPLKVRVGDELISDLDGVINNWSEW